jgi:thymidylate synthase (FAD)
MRTVKAGYEIIDELENKNVIKKLEKIARLCYKSENKIIEDSCYNFISGIVRRKHEAMIEHAVFAFEFDCYLGCSILDLDVGLLKFINFTSGVGDEFIVSGNARAFKDIYRVDSKNAAINSILYFLCNKYPVLFEDIEPRRIKGDTAENEEVRDFRMLGCNEICGLPTALRLDHQYLTVKFIVDRGVSHEIVRHRLAAYAQESTRYCNYSNDKFSGSITLIHSECLTEFQRKRREDYFWKTQELYDLEISEGLTPQIARGILPTALKTEIVVTANLREWRHILKLRTAKTAHPQMREVMIPLLKELKTKIPVIFDDIEISE